MVSFFQEVMTWMNRSTKSDVQSAWCHDVNNEYNPPSSAVKVIRASTDGICYTSDVVWTVCGLRVRRRASNTGFQH